MKVWNLRIWKISNFWKCQIMISHVSLSFCLSDFSNNIGKSIFFLNYGREIDRKLVSSRGNGQTWFVRMAGTRSHKLCGHYLVQVRQQTPIINQAYTSLDVCMNSAKISARVLRKNQKKWVWYGRGSWAFSLKKRGQKSNTCLDIFLKIFFNYLSTS